MTINPDKKDSVEDGPRFLRAIRTRFAQLPPGDHKFSLPVGGLRVFFRARIVERPRQLLFTFHGAVNRDRRASAPFNGFFPGLTDTNQIALSDPSLSLSDKFRIAWFAGHEGFDTQYHIRAALRTIIRTYEIERPIFFGTSGGGFAALYYSYFSPRSVALVFNPQTSITAYHDTLVAPYRKVCWPDLETNEQLAEATCTDVAALYAQGFRNTVIYCQSMGDRHHATSHMLPFVAAVSGQGRARRFLLQSEFKGEHGHVGDNPGYLRWARAVTNSASDDPKDLLDAWYALGSAAKAGAPGLAAPATAPAPAPVSAVASAARPAAQGKGFQPDDLALAERLRAYRETHP